MRHHGREDSRYTPIPPRVLDVLISRSLCVRRHPDVLRCVVLFLGPLRITILQARETYLYIYIHIYIILQTRGPIANCPNTCSDFAGQRPSLAALLYKDNYENHSKERGPFPWHNNATRRYLTPLSLSQVGLQQRQRTRCSAEGVTHSAGKRD